MKIGPKNEKQADELWRKRLKNSVLSLRLTDKEPEKIQELLVKRYKNQLRRLKQSNTDDIIQVYLNSLTELYDPHTNYLLPRTEENFNISMSLSLEGIGAVLNQEDEYTKVVSLVPAGPADKAGQLQPADRIVSVGQGKKELVDVIGWRLDEVVELIRGKKGSTVRLEIIPADSISEETKVISIVRDKVKLEEQAAQKKLIDIAQGDKTYKIGVIELPTFYVDFEAWRSGDPNYKSSTRDVKKLLEELTQENIDGLVIDLRNNGGGSLEEVKDLVDLFIKSGPAVQVKDSYGRIDVNDRSNGKQVYAGPLAVMVNRISASASEIFAGAIQDYDRGIIIGEQSFGKGSVQTLTPVPYGQLKLTIAKFYRVSGIAPKTEESFLISPTLRYLIMKKSVKVL